MWYEFFSVGVSLFLDSPDKCCSHHHPHEGGFPTLKGDVEVAVPYCVDLALSGGSTGAIQISPSVVEASSSSRLMVSSCSAAMGMLWI